MVFLQPLKNVYKSLIYNIKPLIMFELFYRLLGFFIIYPLIRLVFHLAIRLSGYRFITNNVFVDFILKPSTMFFIFLLVVIFSIYILVELIFLALLFDLGYKNEHIRFYDFLILGLKKVGKTFFKYHILIILPSFFFIFIVQVLHIVGIASTINIPPYIVSQLNSMPGLSVFLYILVFIILILFIETIFSIHLFSIERMTFKDAYSESRLILKKNRFKMIREFLIINLVINLILYLFYLLIIVLIGGIISITRGQEYVLGFLLTVLYSTYSFIGLLASIILVPINFSLISTWYYAYKEKNGFVKSREVEHSILINSFDLKWMKRGTLLTLLVLFLLNITTVFSLVLEPSDYVEALHQMDIVAHRGASKDAPENTIASIELALEQGADIIEFDIQLTKDNVIVLMHDYSLRRTTSMTTQTRLSTLNYDDIKDLDAGSWFSNDFEGEKIPTLIEVLSFLGGRARIFIDIKTDSPILDEQLVQILELFEMVDKAVVLSTNRNQLVRIKALNPEIRTLLLLSSFYGDISQLANDSNVDYYGLEQRFVVNASGIIKELQSRGKKIYAWTVSEPSDMENILKYGLDGMITARPYVAREVIYSYRTQTSIVELLTQLFER